ncbi:Nitronate monooxygenase [Wickerhamiella sorbophila]|uniref:Nitronate monooxygenase n=1 Tax=Wickerhamiella sorbophila TaxID=45607 RepID=A0A2T0FQ48_9ASCO|nr:Nitronate monooxygenase [Wickerhamiella sorbophila]PRT57111.1 Nitronate monooxygenase [Wickerhamiella sorbophila]
MAKSLNTWLTRTTGVKVPFMQGGMQNVGTAVMVSAVANAGALGFLTAFTQPTPEALRAEIRKCKELSGNNVFGVNFTLLPAINPPDYVSFAQVAVDEGIWIFETAGNPKPVMPVLKSVKNAIIIHKCVNLKHALKAEKAGVSAITIDGFECAGHPGEEDITTLILLGRCRQEISIPILASGGFADGRTAAAAFAMGAQAVNMGTRWMCTKEAPVHENVKKTIVAAKETDTALLLKPLNNAVRCYNNAVAKKVHAAELDSGKNFEFGMIRDLMAGAKGKQVYETGDVDLGIWSVGQSQGLIHDIPSCQELVDRLVRETIDCLEQGYSIIQNGANL